MDEAVLKVTLRDQDPRSLDEIVEKAREDVRALLDETRETDVAELEYDLLDVAGQWVPTNEALVFIYGQDFLNLLLEDMPRQRWQDYLESHGGPPTPSRIIFEVVREQIYERLAKMAQEMIDARFEAPAEPVGPRSRASSLAGEA